MNKVGDIAVDSYLEILDLYARYTHLIDAGKIEEWVQCFVSDGVLEIPAREVRQEGIAQLRSFGEGHYSRLGGRGKHITTNIALSVNGRDIAGSAYLTMLRRADGSSGPEIFETGRYQDILQKSPDGWCFVSRTLLLD